MIQAFPSYRSDDSLDVSALPWRPRDAENFFDTQHLDLFPKLVSVNPISIPKQVFGCAVEWKGFDDLLGGPRGRWVSRDVKVENTTAVVSKHNKNEQNFKPDRMHREKIDRTELRDVVLEECSPGLGWRLVMTDHVFRRRCLGNLDTQFQEFTANPRCAPDDVLAAHGSNQLTSFPRNLRPSRSAVTNLPGPIPQESSAVPTDDSFRFNDDQGGTPSRPESRQPNPKTPIGTIEQESFGIWSSL